MKLNKLFAGLFGVCLMLIANQGWSLSYLELEQMLVTGMGEDLLKAQVEKENAHFSFEEIVYLHERKLPIEMIEFLLRYYLREMPDIDAYLLVDMKKMTFSDEVIDMLINRYGVENLPLTSDEIIMLKEAKIDLQLIERLIRFEE